MKILVWPLLALALTACMPGIEEVTDDNSNKPVQDITDYSICNGNPSGSVNGNWVTRQKQGDMMIINNMKIADSKIVMTTECSYMGRSLTLEVSSWINYLNSGITIQSAAFKRHKIEETGFNMLCETAITAGTFNYGFRGRCLTLTNAEKTTESSTWVPR
ncbi:hypothetical protein D3C87_88950 [compost metagenome]